MTSLPALLPLLLACAALGAVAAVLAALLAYRLLQAQQRQSQDEGALERALRDESAGSRREAAEAAARQRQELGTALAQFGAGVQQQQEGFGKLMAGQLERFAALLDASGKRTDERGAQQLLESRAAREELHATLAQFSSTQRQQQELFGTLVSGQLERFAGLLEASAKRMDERGTVLTTEGRLGREEQAQALRRFREELAQQLSLLTESNARRLEELRAVIDQQLKTLQTDNAQKLDEMRRTVDEKLHHTLEQRLGESFKLVSERLEQVQRGLGEMQNLAAGVGDLKRVLTNVKTRGTWGEVQLGNLLEQILATEQYAANVATRKGSADRVEYAIRLPGREGGEVVWLPIDAKFPREDYERLIDAQERADPAGVDEAGRQLESRIKLEARAIRDKYVDPPHTTDFALLFLPTEGLYAEVLRRPGLSEALQRDFRVTVAGPTTLTALLNSLQMGFRTLAIEKRSSEVWTVLGGVKTEFVKFGDVLDKVKRKLDEASTQIEATGVRTRAITRKLRNVEALPSDTLDALPEAEPRDGEE